MTYIRPDTLRHINSLTQYPPIPTYHQMDDRGNLQPIVTLKGDYPETDFHLTEKVDGTNARIILFDNKDWIIGSRTELLCARGDRVLNAQLGIVATLQSTAERLADADGVLQGQAVVLFGEVYGAGINGGKAYSTRQTGFRAFDVMFLNDLDSFFSWDLADIARWRDNGNQTFASYPTFSSLAMHMGVAPVPPIGRVTRAELPTDIPGMHQFLMERLLISGVALDDTGHQRPEGLVLRSSNRVEIAKVRFEDYEKVIRKAEYRARKAAL